MAWTVLVWSAVAATRYAHAYNSSTEHVVLEHRKDFVGTTRMMKLERGSLERRHWNDTSGISGTWVTGTRSLERDVLERYATSRATVITASTEY